MWIARGDDGQASVELVAILPVIGLVLLLAWQALLAGETWWLAGIGAREAARASAVGRDPREAARSVLPSRFHSGLHVQPGEPTSLRLQIPPVLTDLRIGSITVKAHMEPQS